MSIRDMITKHISSQITKLCNANLTLDGWKDIVKDHDEDDTFLSFAVFDLRIKAFYLQNLYIKASQYYDVICNFKNIAALALVKTNKQLNVCWK